MAFTDQSVTDFNIAIRAVDTPVATGGVSLQLTGLGFRVVNPWDFNFRHSEGQIAFADGAVDLSDGSALPHDVMLVTDLYQIDAAHFFDDMAAFRRSIMSLNEKLFQYLQFGLYDFVAVGTDTYRKYGRVVGLTAPAVPKTRHHMASPVQLRFRALDPAWYGDTVGTEEITVTAGSGSWISSGDTPYLTKRICWKIRHTGENIGNITIAGAASGETFTITGQTLTTSGHYYWVDVYQGKVSKFSPTESDISGSCSGGFPSLLPVELFTITESTGADCIIDVTYLPRHM
jgi:hypothetical protein